MKYEDKKTLALSLLMIAVLGFFSYRNARNIRDLDRIEPVVTQIPVIEIPPLDEMVPEDIRDLLREYDTEKVADPIDVEYKPLSVRGIITLEYPSHWKELDIPTDAEYSDMIEFFSVIQSQNISHPTILIVSEVKAENLEENLKFLKDAFQRNGISMKITEKIETDGSIYFEAEYKHEDGQILKSKEKMIESNDRIYLVSIVAFSERFLEHSGYMDHILESIQIIK